MNQKDKALTNAPGTNIFLCSKAKGLWRVTQGFETTLCCSILVSNLVDIDQCWLTHAHLRNSINNWEFRKNNTCTVRSGMF